MHCPACDGPVSLDVGPDIPPMTPLSDALFAADADECVEVDRTCWNCGWQERRQIRVESIETTDGDPAAVNRATLIDEIITELEAIKHIATLEDVSAEVRRQRRLEPRDTDTDEEPPW
jgi:hypothetical protein